MEVEKSNKNKVGGGKSERVVPPFIVAIATIYSGNACIGLRICDVNSKERKVMDASMRSCVNQLTNNPGLVKNLYLTPMGIRLKNGNLDRLPKVSASGRLLGNYSAGLPLLIVNQIENIGYTVIDPFGKVRKIPNDKFIEEAKKVGIVNGALKMIPEENREVAVGLEEAYEVIHVAKSRTGGVNNTIKIAMDMSKDTKAIAKNVQVNVDNELGYNDVFKAVSRDQKQVIQDYYMWYTVDVFNSLSSVVNLKVSESKKMKLTELRGDIRWQFGGIRDTGALGFSKCSLGHPLRYEYYAIGYDNKGVAINQIIFGETCSGDFFDISIEDMRKLVKIRKKMSEEIEAMTYVQSNSLNSSMWEKYSLIVSCIKKLSLSGCEEVFGEKISKTLHNFMSVDMPFPESLVKLARKKAYLSENIKQGTGNVFWKKVFPNYANEINLIYSTEARFSQLTKRTYDLLEYMCYNRLDGPYAYDPMHKIGKEEGGFNNKTRTEQRNFLYYTKAALYCSDLTFGEVASLLESYRIMMGTYKYISDYYKDTDAYTELFIVANKLRDRYSREPQNGVRDMYNAVVVSRSCLTFNKEYRNEANRQLLGGVTFKVKRYYADSPLSELFMDKPSNIAEVLEVLRKYGTDRSIFTYLESEKKHSLAKEKEREAEREQEQEKTRETFNSAKKLLEDNMPLDTSKNVWFVLSNKERKGRGIEDVCLLSLNVLPVELNGSKFSVAYTKDLNAEKVNKLVLNYNDGRVKDLIIGLADCWKHILYKCENEEDFSNSLITKAKQKVMVESLIDFDKMGELNKLMDGADESDYKIRISKDILSRGLSYSRLSAPQRKIIDSSLKELMTGEKDKQPAKGSNGVALSEQDKEQFERIIHAATENEKLKKYLMGTDSIGLDIMATVMKYGKISDRQRKHTDNIVESYKVFDL